MNALWPWLPTSADTTLDPLGLSQPPNSQTVLNNSVSQQAVNYTCNILSRGKAYTVEDASLGDHIVRLQKGDNIALRMTLALLIHLPYKEQQTPFSRLSNTTPVNKKFYNATMSYTITVQLYQTNPNTFFKVVEKTVFRDGIWDESKGTHVLTMGASGTSGSLRLVADSGETFIVTLGVHNFKPWGDIVTKLDPASQTGVVITPEYYEREWGGSQNQNRVDARWKTLSSYEVTRDGRKYSFNYTVRDGNNLKVNVVVG